MAELFNLESARDELQSKSIEDIERATAVVWGGRAAAAFGFAPEAADQEARRKWLMDGENYRQEAIEHAAMTEDLTFLQDVIGALDGARQAALDAVRGA